MAEHTDENEAGGNYQVLIEGRAHDWHKDTITVAEIRELGGLPEDRPVIEVDLQDNQMRVLAEDAVHEPAELEPGKGVAKRINFRSG